MSLRLQESEDLNEIVRYSGCYLGSPLTDAEYRGLKLWLDDNAARAALTTGADLEALHAFLRELRPAPVPSMTAVAMQAAKTKIAGALKGLSDILGRVEAAPDQKNTPDQEAKKP